MAWNSQWYSLSLLRAQITGLYRHAWLHVQSYASSAVSVVLRQTSHLCLSSSTQTEGHLITDDKRNNKSKLLIREVWLQECGTARDPSTGRMRRQHCLTIESSLSHRARTRAARAVQQDSASKEPVSFIPKELLSVVI